jgi:hypothetical protein
MKKFNRNEWNQQLAMQNWEALVETEDADLMARTLSKNVNAALDICAPIKTYKIRPAFVTGLSQHTRNIMEERDKA